VLATLRPSRVVTSPLRRAVETATAIAERAGVAVVIDPRLIDRDYGPWAGEHEDAVVAEWGSLDQVPGVEPSDDVVARAHQALDAQLDGSRDGSDVDSVVLVSHDAVNRILLGDLEPDLGQRELIAQRTACWNVVIRVDGVWAVERVDQKVE
jgi:broad specificity phosphatase PhoE